MNYFVYKVEFWDECTYEESIDRGLIAAESASECLASIEKHYGKDNILSFWISYIYSEFGEINNVMSEDELPHTIKVLFDEIGESSNE